MQLDQGNDVLGNYSALGVSTWDIGLSYKQDFIAVSVLCMILGLLCCLL